MNAHCLSKSLLGVSILVALPGNLKTLTKTMVTIRNMFRIHTTLFFIKSRKRSNISQHFLVMLPLSHPNSDSIARTMLAKRNSKLIVKYSSRFKSKLFLQKRTLVYSFSPNKRKYIIQFGHPLNIICINSKPNL